MEASRPGPPLKREGEAHLYARIPLRPSPRLVIAAGQRRGGSLPCAF